MMKVDNENLEAARVDEPDDMAGAVAIIGLAGRFPGAPDTEALWDMMCNGRNAFRRFSAEETEDVFSSDDRADPAYVPVRPSLDDIEKFDAEFFGMFAREAAQTDPQHRLFLELCWEVFEDAGYDPLGCAVPVGVFAGSTMPTYLINNVLGDRSKVEDFTSNYQVGNYGEFVGSMNEVLAMRVAYKLDLRGPAFTLQSACSTSLLTVSQACQNLLDYTCDMALAGGVSVTVPQKRGYMAQQGGMVSTDGVCRPFDADANGTVFGSGGGVVLLKRFEDAVADGDKIVAVIRGCGVNNDGADKVGFTAPSVNGQADAIAMALANANVEPHTIGYLECHGTATPMGDPIEFSGIKAAYGATGDARCALGSLKGNLGHMDAAAGICSLIKAAMVIDRAKIPAVANFKTPNPRLKIEDTRYFIPDETVDWSDATAKRRAGVSAFGVGGTNVHVVLEQAPEQPAATLETDGHFVLPLSARSNEALGNMRRNLADHLEANPDLSLAAVAHTLQEGRHHFAQRCAIAASSTAEAAEKLAAVKTAGVKGDETPPVVFMFPGQGAQYVGMGAALYRQQPEFALWIDRGAELLEPHLKLDLRDFICHEGPVDDAMAERQRETGIAQPCLYLVEYALARLWMSRGLKPTAMIGHSVGEFVAATMANVMSFEDGLMLVANRGRLMQAQPQGAMVSVRTQAENLTEFVNDQVEIAAINAPKLCVISGPFEAVDAVCEKLEKAEIAFSKLHTSHAFHSAMMEEAASALHEETAKVSYGTATIPYISCVTGAWQTDDQGASPAYWARHCRDAVRFADGLQTLCKDQMPVMLEVGPGRTLSVFAAQTIARDGLKAVVQSLPEHDRASAAGETLATTHGNLWAHGCAINWPDPSIRTLQKIALPTYPFQRQRHWIDAPPAAGETAAPTPSTPAEEQPVMTIATPIAAADRTPSLEAKLLGFLTDMSGENLSDDDKGATFLELGFDSLFIGQFAQKIEKQFKVKLSFRELLSSIPTIIDLAAYLDAQMPPDAIEPVAAAPAPMAQPAAIPPVKDAAPAPASGTIEAVLQQQLEVAQNLFSQQLQTLQGIGGQVNQPIAATKADPIPAPSEAEIGGDRIKLYKPSAKSSAPKVTPEKEKFITEMASAYAAKSPQSKSYVDANRAHLADPRTASGFNSSWKEMVFPVVSDRSKGSQIWDIDGNEYIDLVNGFGQTAFGHAPDFVVDAVHEQMDAGFAIGPQTSLAGEIAKTIADMTGQQRVTFCNTGSEAVMAAMRLARAVTGNERIVVFANDYHGQFDEVLVKGRNRAGDPIALPIAPGIPEGSVSNMTVLKYGAPESVAWIRDHADDIAAVIVEPVQSRHPELQPVEFVRELRDVATEQGFALVFDEVVTGFRVDPGGMQALWDIKADMATYGKVLGGGMPIGVLAGQSRFLDALDGGHWTYGDDSMPMTAPTFFAGTFVRHPLVLAACRATLKHIKGDGAALYDRVAKRTEALVKEIQADLAARGITNAVYGYKSWFSAHFTHDDPLGSLMFAQLRLRGIHVQEGYPCFLTTAHSEEDFQAVAAAFRDSADALQAAGILSPVHRKIEAKAPDLPSEPDIKHRPEIGPLTEAQREIWMAAQAGDEASCAFNESLTLDFDGPLDARALETALARVMKRHDALQICFARDGSQFEIMPNFEPTLERVDITAEENKDTCFDALLKEEATTAFDLVEGPLVRAKLVKFDDERAKLIFTAHHIVCDGWSCNLTTQELGEAYRSALKGSDAQLDDAASFTDYALTHSRSSEGGAETEKYWLGQFETVPDLPEMPLDRPHPDYKTFKGGTRSGTIKADDYKALKKAGGKAGATLFSTLLAALQVMVSRLSDSRDVVIAIPSAGQSLLDNQTLVGHCVNLLPIRAQLKDDTTFDAYLKTVQQRVLDAFEHQDYTYGTLVQKLGVKRDPRRLPLTEIQFNLERLGENADFGDVKVGVKANAKAFVNFDLFLNLVESADGIQIDVDYNGDVLDADTVDRWIGHYITLVKAVAADIKAPVAKLPLVDDDQLKWLSDTLNETVVAYDREAFVHILFAKKAAETPDAVAVRHGDTNVTYGDLDVQANRLARHLQATVPGTGNRIALLVDRSPQMLVALLAIMKAGHTYVPLDPAHPEARLRQTLEAADVAALICESDAMAQLAGENVGVIRLDSQAKAIAARGKTAPKMVAADKAPPAYIIFTSGSTGTPKGVEVGHRALVNFLLSMQREPGFTADDTILAVTTVSFDIAALELYLPLICGGTVMIADRLQVQDGFALLDIIRDHRPTVIQATPTLWRILVEAGLGTQSGLKMLSGGEPLPQDLAASLLATDGELWNMYGPTETTIWSSVQQIEDADAPITIGHPIANTALHIVDGFGRIAPVGVAGELLIGGDGLANGYFGRPDLTDKAFVDLEIGSGKCERLYRTGDLGRRLADGSLQVLGRRDNQIKLRGFRIELGEIESVMEKFDGIRQCAVVAVTNASGVKQLVGHVLPVDMAAKPSVENLMDHAKAHLPAHMVPALWQVDEAFPHTANGKLDRIALEKLGLPQHKKTETVTAPQTPLQEKLSHIWQEVLDAPSISIDDNLYALGADSLTIFRIASRMLDAGLNLEAKHLLRHPSIKQLADYASAADVAAPKDAQMPSLRDFRGGARRPMLEEGAL